LDGIEVWRRRQETTYPNPKPNLHPNHNHNPNPNSHQTRIHWENIGPMYADYIGPMLVTTHWANVFLEMGPT